MRRKEQLKRELDRVVKVLIEKYRPRKIILFGSLARGNLHEGSDADIVIVMETKDRFIDRIGNVIDLCRPRVAMDFIVYTPEEFQYLIEVEPFIQEEVVGKGEILYEAA